MITYRQDVLRSRLEGVMVGEVFPTHSPYDVDERIGKIVGCVYTFTCGWVAMHSNVLRSDQMQRIVVNTRPNGDFGLYSSIDEYGKKVLYLDKHCTQEW